MCGIFGVIKKPIAVPKTLDFLQQAIVSGTFRGRDSTGLMSVDKDNEVLMYKKPVPGWDMQYYPPAIDILTNVWDKRFIIGHNRKATRGKVSTENAHPFSHKHIHLVHNGTVASAPLNGNSLVDSSKIAYTMALKGEKPTLEMLDGAYALVWYNDQDQTLNLARNEHRELSLAFAKDNQTIYFASEGKMLEWLLDRNNVDIKDIQLLPTLHHYKIPLEFTNKMKIGKFTEYTKPAPPATINTRRSEYAGKSQPPLSIGWHNTRKPLIEKGEQFQAKCEGMSVVNIDGQDTNCYLFRQRTATESDWYIPKNGKRVSYKEGRWYLLRAVDAQSSIYSNIMLRAMMIRKLNQRAVAALNAKDIAEKKSCIYKEGESVTFEVDDVISNTDMTVETNSVDVIGETIDKQAYPIVVYHQPSKRYYRYEDCMYEGRIKKINNTKDGGFQIELDGDSIIVIMDENGEWKPEPAYQQEIDKSNSKPNVKSNLSRGEGEPIPKCYLCHCDIIDPWGYVLTSEGKHAHSICHKLCTKYNPAIEQRRKH